MSYLSAIQAFDWRPFVQESTAYLQETLSGSLEAWQSFCDESGRSTQLKKDERLSLAKCALTLLAHNSNPNTLLSFLRVTELIRENIGPSVLSILLTKQFQRADKITLDHYLELFQLIMCLKDSDELIREINRINDIHRLRERLLAQYKVDLTRKFPKRQVDELFSIWREHNQKHGISLNEESLGRIAEVYHAIMGDQYDYLSLSFENLKKIAWDAGRVLASDSKNSEARKNLICALAEVVRRLYGIMPHDTQLLALLAIIEHPEEMKGRLAKINTGEGKTLLIAMLSAYFVCLGQYPDLETRYGDVFTSNDYLARVAEAKFSPFYNVFGITSSFIHQNSTQKDFHAQILYGTASSFAFARMRDGLYNAKLCYSRRSSTEPLSVRPYDVAIADEVDVLLIDEANSSANMAIPVDEDIGWVYGAVLEQIDEDPDISTDKLREQLAQFENGKYVEQVHEFDDERLDEWLKRAKHALTWKESVDFVRKTVTKTLLNGEVIKREEAVIIARVTGRKKEGSRWEDHSFLEARLGIPVRIESLTAASFSPANYFAQYRHLFGVTGTMGEKVEQKEVEKHYLIEPIVIPPHKPSQRKMLSPEVTFTKENHYQQLLRHIAEMRQAGRPILILFNSIESSEAFAKELVSKHVPHHLLNDIQEVNEDYIVKRAGQPGSVTIATNAAGRGTDFILPETCKKAGGLRSLFAEFDETERSEEQGFGRCARQGEKGDAGWCLCLPEEDPSQSAEDILAKLKAKRTEKTEEASLQRGLQVEKRKVLMHFLQEFFQNMKKVYDWFEDSSSKAHFEQLCEELISQERLAEHTKITKHWEPMIHALKDELLALQSKSSTQAEATIHWERFFDSFKALYNRFLLTNWAKFYTSVLKEKPPVTLQVETTSGRGFFSLSQDETASTRGKYAAFLREFGPGFSEVSVGIQHMLESLLAQACKELQPAASIEEAQMRLTSSVSAISVF